jgi:hypothetical protein
MAVSEKPRDKTPTFREQMRRQFQSGRVNRVSNRQLRRAALSSIQSGMRMNGVLMAVLAQSGGEVTVTKGTIDQVDAKMGRLGWTIVAGATHNEFIVRMVEGGEETAPLPVEAEIPLPTDEEIANSEEMVCGE